MQPVGWQGLRTAPLAPPTHPIQHRCRYPAPPFPHCAIVLQQSRPPVHLGLRSACSWPLVLGWPGGARCQGWVWGAWRGAWMRARVVPSEAALCSWTSAARMHGALQCQEC
eukprot:scaffold63914_cov16-Tisochrysis_lutea.AAC.1